MPAQVRFGCWTWGRRAVPAVPARRVRRWPRTTLPTTLSRTVLGGRARRTAPVHAATGDSVGFACVDPGYTGEQPAGDARAHGIAVSVVTLPEAKHGFGLRPRRRVAERSLAVADSEDGSLRLT